MIRGFYDRFKITNCLVAQTLTGNGDSTDCTSVDMRGYGMVTFLVSVGNSADTLSGSLYEAIEVQESDDNSTFTAAADAVVRLNGGDPVTGANTGTLAVINAPAEDQVLLTGEYHGTKRYARITIDRTGNHASGTPHAVVALQGAGTYLPAA